MELSWTVRKPGSMRLSKERLSGAEDYITQMEELLALGEGYSEVSYGDQPYPRLSFAFRVAYGVVAHWSSAEEMFLLAGDGIVADNKIILVPELEGDAKYTGAFISDRQRAWNVVKKFIGSGSVDDLGQWAKS